MTATVDPRLARQILQRMGETGQPPERGALRVNVATEEILELLRQEYLRPIRELGLNSTFKLVQAPFGGGKTHFLHCFREVAWQEGFATALVGVSPQECPFDDLKRIYQRVAERLELPPEREDVEPDPGVDRVLTQVAESRLERHPESQVLDWIRSECGEARVESHAWRRAAVLYLEAVVTGDPDRRALLGAFLRGENVSLKEVQPLGVRESLEPPTGFRWLRSLVQFLRAVDIPGIVLMFDELDRVMSLSVRRRKAIGDNLRQLIDHCGQSTLPGAVCFYAVPPEFLTNVVPEYPALDQRLSGAGTFSTLSPISPIIDLDHLPLPPEEVLRRIGEKLLALYQVGWPEKPLTAKTQRQNLSRLAEELGATQLEAGTRRTYVRVAVRLLFAQARGGERELTLEEIRRLAGEGADAGPALEGEEVFA